MVEQATMRGRQTTFSLTTTTVPFVCVSAASTRPLFISIDTHLQFRHIGLMIWAELNDTATSSTQRVVWHSTPTTPLPPSRDGESPLERTSFSPQPRPSDGSEGYPSWLPKRPPPPAPTSTLHSMNHGVHDTPEQETYAIGRKPTPRSVRMVSLPTDTALRGDRREPTDQTRVPSSNPRHSRVWSRITSAGRSPTLASALHAQERLPRPRLRAVGLHPELVRNPSILARIYFYFLPFFTFYHVPLQTFFDFNAVFILLEVAKYPNPSAPGVPGSGKNWALAAAAYIASWAVWIFIVTIMYEVIYSFYRRWRVKRPLLVPLYLSSSAFNLVSMTSYSHFSLMQHIRWSAFFGESGSIRDGLAETFWWYSQNLPTVALLLPRAGLCLALLFAFSFPNPEYVGLLDAGMSNRDDTYFRASDGTLTDYSRGCLIANAAWAAWRILLLLLSWSGLWIVSGHGCAGLCGPRYRWEEEDAEKTVSIYGDNSSLTDAFDALPWDWRAITRLRVQQAYEFCLTTKPANRWSSIKKEEPDIRELLGVETTPAFNTEQIMAAVYPQSQHRRAALSEDLFQRPPKAEGVPATPSPDIVPPKVAKRRSRDRELTPTSVYPFTARGAQISSKDKIPFPPSPSSRKEKQSNKSQSPKKSHSISEFGEMTGIEAEEEGDVVDEEAFASSDAHPRTSGSLSSLGHPIASRYPFQFRWPGRGGSTSSSRGGHTHTHSTDQTHSTLSSNSRSAPSHATQSTGNAETSSGSPSHDHSTSMSSSSYGSPIPMPPRHPTAGRGRARAGTVPTTFPTSSSSVVYTGTVLHSRVRTDSDHTDDSHGPYGPYGSYSDAEEEEDGTGEDEMEMMEQPIPDGPQEAAEGEDSVGLLRVASRSPRGSLVSSGRSRRRRARTTSSLSNSPSGSNSNSGSGSNSRTSSRSRPSLPPRSRAGSAVRSRTQSLIQSIGAASRSSVDVVQAIRERTRTNSSRARLEDEYVYSSDAQTHGTHSRSGSDALSSGQENYTFGQPLRPELRGPYGERRLREVKSDLTGSVASRGTRRHTESLVSEAPSHATQTSQAPTEHAPPRPPRSPKRLSAGAVPIPGKTDSAGSSKADLSTAPASFVTGSATITGSSDTGEHAAHPAHWGDTGHMVHRDHHGPGPA